MKTIRCYSELILLPTFEERFEYLRLEGSIGIATFGFDRYLNQALYRSREWKEVRNYVIIRDQGCDLGIEGYEIAPMIDAQRSKYKTKIIIHHMNPIDEDDILSHNPIIMDPEFLISTSMNTHNAIHYGDSELLNLGLTERKQNDTIPWR